MAYVGVMGATKLEKHHALLSENVLPKERWSITPNKRQVPLADGGQTLGAKTMVAPEA